MIQPLPLSVAIITLNEEQNLPRCLGSVRDLAREIIVVDSGSTDRTEAIAREHGAQFEFSKWPGYVAQKNIALRRCSQPWVLCLDADEELSPELRASISEFFAAGEPQGDGAFVNRRTWYLGEWIRHAWYPEWRLRLVRRERAGWTGVDPHDKLTVTGSTCRLEGDLLHYPFADLREHFRSEINHAHTMAQSYAKLGRRFHWHQVLLLPGAEFLKRLILKQAWRDGWRGWIIAGVRSAGVFAKYAFLLEQSRRPPA